VVPRLLRPCETMGAWDGLADFASV
jgi:hypothetical protein